MIDINFFANKPVEARHDATACAGERTNGFSAGRTHETAELHVTFRGVVYPWHMDHMKHMNVRHYTAAFDEASWVVMALLGLDSSYFERHRRGMAALEQSIQYKCELRAGEAFEIRSRVLE